MRLSESISRDMEAVLAPKRLTSPMERATNSDLVFNLKTFKPLGITICCCVPIR